MSRSDASRSGGGTVSGDERRRHKLSRSYLSDLRNFQNHSSVLALATKHRSFRPDTGPLQVLFTANYVSAFITFKHLSITSRYSNTTFSFNQLHCHTLISLSTAQDTSSLLVSSFDSTTMPFTNAAEKITGVWDGKEVPSLQGKVAIVTTTESSRSIDGVGWYVAYSLA